ncbi:MAG: transcription elongation factor GreA [Parvibaculaceae bacterium]
MSRAFVKEQDDGAEDFPERPVSSNPNFVTPEGVAAIETELLRLAKEHAQARAAEDKGTMARTARDLRYWQARRASAQVVEPPADKETVQFGSTVTLERDDGRVQTFRIVGEDEAEPSEGTISHASPLARALFGKRVGDTVKAGAGEAEVTRIG